MRSTHQHGIPCVGLTWVELALVGVKPRVVMVSRLRGDAALYHRLGPHPPQGTRQRSLQSWAERADTPWEDVEVAWYGGQRTQRWVFSRTALWYTPRLPPVAIRSVLVADCLALVRRHLWRARYAVTSTVEPEFVPFPRDACEFLRSGLPLAA